MEYFIISGGFRTIAKLWDCDE